MHGFASFRRAALVALWCLGASSARADSCPTSGSEPVNLGAVVSRLELRLADGRLLRLAGLEAASATPHAPDLEAKSSAAFAALLAHHPLAMTILSPKPDRWGRLVAFASLPDAPPGGLAAMALAAGLARYRPEAAAASCRAALLAAEDGARRAHLGLWADPYYGVMAADDRTALSERVGTDVVVEARLRAVEPGVYRTRLRFEGANATQAGPHERLIEATIVPRAMKRFAAQGVDLRSLVGRTLRLRGLLDRRFGPRIELAGPDEIEVLPVSTAPARSN